MKNLDSFKLDSTNCSVSVKLQCLQVYMVKDTDIFKQSVSIKISPVKILCYTV